MIPPQLHVIPWLAFKRLLLKLKSYDPVNFDGKGCLGPISATSFYSDSQQGKRHYYLEGKKKILFTYY